MRTPQPVAPNADDGHGDIPPVPGLYRLLSDGAPWWNPNVPILQGLLACMEEKGAQLVGLDGTGTTYHRDYIPYDEEGKRGLRSQTRTHGPLTAQVLLDEQIESRDEQFLFALAAPLTRFRVRHLTVLPIIAHPDQVEDPTTPRLLQMNGTVRWSEGPRIQFGVPTISTRLTPVS